MKKWSLMVSVCLYLCLLAGCASPASGGEPPVSGGMSAKTSQESGTSAEELQTDSETLQLAAVTTACRIVDGAEDGHLLLAELTENDGVYRLALDEDIPVYLDGEPADASALEDGMPIDVTHGGLVLDSFPGQFGQVERIDAFSLGTERNPGGSYYDLCGFYLKVLDDLWQVDSALNEGKPRAALDLSRAPGELSESEKRAIVHRFGEEHGVDAFAATMEELLEQGHIAADPLGAEDAPADAKFYHWDDGCLFSITPHESEEEEIYMGLPVLRFDAEKYASSLGAYIFYDCTAAWPQMGTWSDYQVGAEMIS